MKKTLSRPSSLSEPGHKYYRIKEDNGWLWEGHGDNEKEKVSKPWLATLPEGQNWVWNDRIIPMRFTSGRLKGRQF